MPDDKTFERDVTQGGHFPKEPDEGDEEVIDHELARQKQQQGGIAPPAAERGGDEHQKQATIDSTKGLP